MVGTAAAVVLAAIFVWAAVAKLRDRPATLRAFTAAGLPAPDALAVVVPAVELVLAGLLLAVPPWGRKGATMRWTSLSSRAVVSDVIGTESPCTRTHMRSPRRC